MFKITTILIQIIYFEKLKLKVKKLISYTLKIMLEFDLSKLWDLINCSEAGVPEHRGADPGEAEAVAGITV